VWFKEGVGRRREKGERRVKVTTDKGVQIRWCEGEVVWGVRGGGGGAVRGGWRVKRGRLGK